MTKRVKDEIKLEGVRLIWRNFAGEARQYNAEGKRNFAIPLDEETAKHMRDLGWNVKSKETEFDGVMETLHHISVNVKMDGKVPPKIFVITKSKNRRNALDEDTVSMLDWAEFDTVDVILRPYNWVVNGNEGVSAYLKTLFAVLHEDDLEKKYAHIPEDDGTLAIEAADGVLDLDDTDYWETDEEQKAIEA